MAALQDVPDPRKAKGKRHAWTLILTLIVAALASGQQSGRAIAQWVQEQTTELLLALQPTRGQLPGETTLRRALRSLDVAALEQRLAALEHPTDGVITTTSGQVLQAQAVDGKTVRGATRLGTALHLVSLVTHGSGTTLAQVAAAGKGREVAACATLLEGRDLRGIVITTDALHTQRAQAQRILDGGGEYLMVVKRNQPQLHDDLALFFDLPAIAADQEHWDQHQTTTKGHGRIELRTLESTTGDCAALGWPGAAQLLRRTCERTGQKTGKCTVTVTYGITSVPPTEADAALLERLWRGHWTIESQSHYVRDVTMGEDACQIRRGTAPRALAALRSAIIDLFRGKGWTSIADALRHYGASVKRVLTLIGAVPPRL